MLLKLASPYIPEAAISAADFAILRGIFRFDPKDPVPSDEVEAVQVDIRLTLD